MHTIILAILEFATHHKTLVSQVWIMALGYLLSVQALFQVARSLYRSHVVFNGVIWLLRADTVNPESLTFSYGQKASSEELAIDHPASEME